MRKFFCALLCLVLPLCLIGCGEEISPKSGLKYEVTTDDDKSTLCIYNEKSEKLLQKIKITLEDQVTEQPYYLEDVNFDGECELLVPLSYDAAGVFFNAYEWNGKEKKFEKLPSFKNIINPVIDSEGRQILSARRIGEVRSYDKYEFKDGKFIMVASLAFKLQDNRFEFTENGTHLEAPKAFSVAAMEEFSIEKPDSSDPQLAPYYEDGSFWDLDSEKWDDKFFAAFLISVI